MRNKHNAKRSIVFTGGMNRTPTLTPQTGNRLWGIYHTDREYAREQGDPLRMVIEARTKIAAEELAAHLGFSEPSAQPITVEQAKRAQWLPKHRARWKR